MKKDHFWLNLISRFLIPGYTLLFAGSKAWFRSNFSVIAVMGEDHYRGFVYWGILGGGYFFVLLTLLCRSLPGRAARIGGQCIAVCAVLSLSWALAIPYLPDRSPFYAALHVLLAAQACVLLMLALLVILLSLRREEPARWRAPLRAWWSIVAISALLFWIPRMVSTALEVFFTLSATLLVRDMWLRIPR